VGSCKAFTRNICANSTQYGGDGGADIRADGQRQGVFIADLAYGQRGDDKGQGGMAGLHDHCGHAADQGKYQEAGYASHGVLGQVDLFRIGGEALFHIMDPEKKEADADQYPAEAFQFLGSLHQQQYAEHQHRKSVGRELHLQTKACDKPRPRGSTQVGTKYNTNTLSQTDEFGTQERDGNHRNQR